MKIDCHVHIGCDPLFYINRWSPYALGLPEFLVEAERSGVGRSVVFPFVSYLDLDLVDMREGKISYSGAFDGVPYRFENRRLLEEIYRLHPGSADRVLPFLMADPGRFAVGERIRRDGRGVSHHRGFGLDEQRNTFGPVGTPGNRLSLADKAPVHG